MFRSPPLSALDARGESLADSQASGSAWLVGTIALALVALTTTIPDLVLFPGAPVGDVGDLTLRSTLVTAPIYLYFALLGISQPAPLLRLIRRCVPLMLLLALVIASTLWSSDPGTTLRKSVSFAASAMIGVFIVARMGPLGALRATIWFLGLCVLTSVVLAIAAPHLAVHQGVFLEPPEFTGLWRGVFVNKNQLGHIAALTLALATLSGHGVFRSETYRWIIAGAALGCLMMSQSGGGFTTALTIYLAYAYLLFLRTLNTGAQKLAVFSGVLIFVPLVLAAEHLVGAAVGLIGKDPTLTGRTMIWELVADFAKRDLWFGTGFWTGFQEIRPHLLAALGWDPPNAHNTFLDVVIALGVIGFVVFTAMLAHYGRSSLFLASAQRAAAVRMREAPYLLFVFAVVLSAVESSVIAERHAVSIAVFVGYAAAQALFGGADNIEPKDRTLR